MSKLSKNPDICPKCRSKATKMVNAYTNVWTCQICLHEYSVKMDRETGKIVSCLRNENCAEWVMNKP